MTITIVYSPNGGCGFIIKDETRLPYPCRVGLCLTQSPEVENNRSNVYIYRTGLK